LVNYGGSESASELVRGAYYGGSSFGCMEFKDRIRKVRGSDSQTVAATKAGISQQMWSKLEKGKLSPDDTSVLPAIQRAYPTYRLEWLVSGAPPMHVIAAQALGVHEVGKPYGRPGIILRPDDPDTVRPLGKLQEALVSEVKRLAGSLTDEDAKALLTLFYRCVKDPDSQDSTDEIQKVEGSSLR